MDWSEKDIEEYLAADPSLIGCDEILGRQVQVGVGIVDLVALRREDRFGQMTFGPCVVVVELKKGQIDCAAVGQLNRYIEAMTDKAIHTPQGAVRLKGLLVGTGIEPDAMTLADALSFEFRQYAVHLQVRTGVMVIRPLTDRLHDDYLDVLRRQVQALGSAIKAIQ